MKPNGLWTDEIWTNLEIIQEARAGNRSRDLPLKFERVSQALLFFFPR